MPDHVLNIAGTTILPIMAVEAEYGPALQALISPVFTGVGPVEAACAVTATLCELNASSKLPDIVLCLGSAGSNKLAQTEVYQVSSVTFRDMDASPLGFEIGQTPFLDRPIVELLPCNIPGIAQATLSTGAAIISGADYDKVNADMVDMETYAVLRACQRFDVKLIGLRGISDGTDELKTITDWTQYLHIVDQKLGQACQILFEEIKSTA